MRDLNKELPSYLDSSMNNFNEYAIYANNLSKNFVSYKKTSGFKGSLKAVFNREYINKAAVNDFEMKIEKGKIIGLLRPKRCRKNNLNENVYGNSCPE